MDRSVLKYMTIHFMVHTTPKYADLFGLGFGLRFWLIDAEF